MRIVVSGVTENQFQHIRPIILLYFDDVEIIHMDDYTGTTLLADDMHIGIQLIDQQGYMECVVNIDHPLLPSCNQSERLPVDQHKRLILVTIVKALTAFTGIEQPWGILTGIRPLKLYHQRLQLGQSVDEINNALQENYLITPEKVQLLQSIADKQLQVIPDLYTLDKEVSVYIGIPFCPTKCAYCTFPAYAITRKNGTVDSFLAGLHDEIQAVGQWLKENHINVTSIYFGGGTPTSIEAEELDALFEAIQFHFPKGLTSRELTVEAGRPDTITREKLEVMKKWKVDRISINPQTFTMRTLKAIGRHHTVDEIMEKFALAREVGMNNINMDLIIGLPGEGMAEYLDSLSKIEQLKPESLTVHTLSFKTASTMTKNKDKYPVADRETITNMVKVTADWTKAHGYAPYYVYRQKNILGNQENVGYALAGRESIYNIMIMEEMQTIIGLGCGASSKIINPTTKKITRYANPKEPKVYNELVHQYIEKKLKLLDEQILGKV